MNCQLVNCTNYISRFPFGSFHSHRRQEVHECREGRESERERLAVVSPSTPGPGLCYDFPSVAPIHSRVYQREL